MIIIDEINQLNKSKSKSESKSFLKECKNLPNIQEEDKRKRNEMNFNEVSEESPSKLSNHEKKVSSYIDDPICNEILEKFSKKISEPDDPDYNKYKKCFEKREIAVLQNRKNQDLEKSLNL